MRRITVLVVFFSQLSRNGRFKQQFYNNKTRRRDGKRCILRRHSTQKLIDETRSPKVTEMVRFSMWSQYIPLTSVPDRADEHILCGRLRAREADKLKLLIPRARPESSSLTLYTWVIPRKRNNLHSLHHCTTRHQKAYCTACVRGRYSTPSPCMVRYCKCDQ